MDIWRARYILESVTFGDDKNLIEAIEKILAELDQQEKIINTMAKDIYTTDLYENICGTNKLIDDCYIDNFTKENSACIECIKQYYEKVSEE